MVTKTVWAVVRLDPDTGDEFVVTSEIGATHLEATLLEDVSRERAPSWHAANHVRRIASFTMTEDAQP